MTEDQFKKLADMIQPSQQQDVFNVGFKALQFVLATLVVWIFSTTNSMQRDVREIKVNYEHTSAKLEGFQQFMKEPRFTERDFENKTEPFILQIESNKKELDERETMINNVEEKLDELDNRVRDLEIKSK